MKILSDFDGVLTDLAEEAARVRALFLEGIEGAAGGDGETARMLARTAEAAMVSEPAAHGWRVDGRLTAFADEDDFIRVNGLAAALDQLAASGDALAGRVARGLPSRGATDFKALAQSSYLRMARETASGAIHPLDPGAVRVLQELATRGHEVVVVSNSGTKRIIDILEGAGLSPIAHGGASKGSLRVRGDAKKFVLGAGPRPYRVARRVIETDRPHYAAILEDEQPEVVVGDVLSLDLALPILLANSASRSAAPLQVFLRRRPYTPAWSVAHLTSLTSERVRARVIDDLDALLEIDPHP